MKTDRHMQNCDTLMLLTQCFVDFRLVLLPRLFVYFYEEKSVRLNAGKQTTTPPPDSVKDIAKKF